MHLNYIFPSSSRCFFLFAFVRFLECASNETLPLRRHRFTQCWKCWTWWDASKKEKISAEKSCLTFRCLVLAVHVITASKWCANWDRLKHKRMRAERIRYEDEAGRRERSLLSSSSSFLFEISIELFEWRFCIWKVHSALYSRLRDEGLQRRCAQNNGLHSIYHIAYAVLCRVVSCTRCALWNGSSDKSFHLKRKFQFSISNLSHF